MAFLTSPLVVIATSVPDPNHRRWLSERVEDRLTKEKKEELFLSMNKAFLNKPLTWEGFLACLRQVRHIARVSA